SARRWRAVARNWSTGSPPIPNLRRCSRPRPSRPHPAPALPHAGNSAAPRAAPAAASAAPQARTRRLRRFSHALARAQIRPDSAEQGGDAVLVAWAEALTALVFPPGHARRAAFLAQT